MNEVIVGDCLEVMPTLEANSVDTIITDPPYGLSFMGKAWDHGVPGVPFWEAALRVAKPGAFLLAFGGTRTHHRLMVAIEDAGWEVRDCMMWLHGQGFPKSHDIGKALRPARKSVESYPDPRKVRTTTFPEPKSSAEQWEGWGTALKPAWEPIIVAMKPTDGTFANNALKHGVAGLNVDGSRVEITDGASLARKNKPGANGWKNSSGGPNKAALEGEPAGRWPANVILDEDAGAMLDEQTGELHARGNRKPTKRDHSNGVTGWGGTGVEADAYYFHDSGGASRFFYVAKASRKERDAGLEERNPHPTVKPLDLMRYLAKLTATPTGGVVLDPFAGSGSTLIAAMLEGRGFIGIEQNAEYAEIARARLEHWAQEGTQPELIAV